ncbi:TetR/AcrR family transcriptional regulator [Leifsonia sp. L25]|uniref:TetR/AcrR family transcriptional regulator n=1 Tax=Leifsonia sp. L25 TaxID=3423957 RepID=UPI003D693632
MAGVKRQYDGTARRARAEKMRESLIETARAMLVADGYAALTIPKVARACEVSVESVYKRFAGKPALVRAVVEEALRGIGPIAAETRSDALSAADLPGLLHGWGRLSAEVGPRVAPILLLLDAAAGHDPELADLARELEEDRRARMTENALRLADAGHLPPGLPVRRVADILLTYSSPQLYDLIVIRNGWTLDQYADFISTGIAAHLSARADRTDTGPADTAFSGPGTQR